MTNTTVSRGLLLSGVVHGDVFMTPERVNYALENADQREKIASLVMHPAMQIAQTVQAPQIRTLATLFARNEKLKTEGTKGEAANTQEKTDATPATAPAEAEAAAAAPAPSS